MPHFIYQHSLYNLRGSRFDVLLMKHVTSKSFQRMYKYRGTGHNTGSLKRCLAGIAPGAPASEFDLWPALRLKPTSRFLPTRRSRYLSRLSRP